MLLRYPSVINHFVNNSLQEARWQAIRRSQHLHLLCHHQHSRHRHLYRLHQHWRHTLIQEIQMYQIVCTISWLYRKKSSITYLCRASRRGRPRYDLFRVWVRYRLKGGADKYSLFQCITSRLPFFSVYSLYNYAWFSYHWSLLIQPMLSTHRR